MTPFCRVLRRIVFRHVGSDTWSDQLLRYATYCDYIGRTRLANLYYRLVRQINEGHVYVDRYGWIVLDYETRRVTFISKGKRPLLQPRNPHTWAYYVMDCRKHMRVI